MDVTLVSMASSEDWVVVRAFPACAEEDSSTSSVEGACLRFRDLSWARRVLRSLAAAERASWEDMVRLWSMRWRKTYGSLC